MKQNFILVLLLLLGCQSPTDSSSVSTLEGITKLCNCRNTEGKTIETRSREILGPEFYQSVNSIETFTEAIKSNNMESEKLNKMIESEFIRDEIFTKCSKRSLKGIDFEKPLPKDKEAEVVNFFNQKKEFTVYQTLPTLIVYFKQGE